MMQNKTILDGKVYDDIQLRELESRSGKFDKFTVINFRLEFITGSRQKQKKNLAQCKAYNARAIAISKQFSKGSEICITGELEEETWTSKDGKQRSKLVILIDKVEHLENIEINPFDD